MLNKNTAWDIKVLLGRICRLVTACFLGNAGPAPHAQHSASWRQGKHVPLTWRAGLGHLGYIISGQGGLLWPLQGTLEGSDVQKEPLRTGALAMPGNGWPGGNSREPLHESIRLPVLLNILLMFLNFSKPNSLFLGV